MTIRITDNRSRIDNLMRNIADIEKKGVEIGVLAEAGSFYLMIANVHEFGMKINAKGKSLAIPTAEAGDRRPSDFGRELFKPKDKNILAVQEGEKLVTMFILVQSVNIPERSYIRSTFDENNNKWNEFAEGLIMKVMDGTMTVDQMYNQIGARVAADIQQKITDISEPPNSALTIARKKSSNPLIDTGGLRSRITWRVVNV